MNLLAKAKSDLAAISQKDFAIDLTFDDTAGKIETIKGWGIKHHISIDEDTGLAVNSKNAHCSFSESVLAATGYPIRDGNDEVKMKFHKVTFKNSNDVSKIYMINQTFPDESLGIITCILGDFE